MTWFYRVPHYIMTSDAPGRPPRPTNQEVLEVQDDQTESVMMVCRRVVEMDKAGIKSRLFEDGSPQLALVENMIVELQNGVQYIRKIVELRNVVHYRRERRRHRVRHTH